MNSGGSKRGSNSTKEPEDPCDFRISQNPSSICMGFGDPHFFTFKNNWITCPMIGTRTLLSN